MKPNSQELKSGNFSDNGTFKQGHEIGKLQNKFGPRGRISHFNNLCEIIGEELAKEIQINPELLEKLKDKGLEITSYLAVRKLIVYFTQKIPTDDTAGRSIAFGALKEYLARVAPKIQSVEMNIKSDPQLHIHIEDKKLEGILNDYMRAEREQYALPASDSGDNGNGNGNGNGEKWYWLRS